MSHRAADLAHASSQDLPSPPLVLIVLLCVVLAGEDGFDGKEGEGGGGGRRREGNAFLENYMHRKRERETVGSGNMASASVRRQMGFILFSNLKHFDENKTGNVHNTVHRVREIRNPFLETGHSIALSFPHTTFPTSIRDGSLPPPTHRTLNSICLFPQLPLSPSPLSFLSAAAAAAELALFLKNSLF